MGKEDEGGRVDCMTQQHTHTHTSTIGERRSQGGILSTVALFCSLFHFFTDLDVRIQLDPSLLLWRCDDPNASELRVSIM